MFKLQIDKDNIYEVIINNLRKNGAVYDRIADTFTWNKDTKVITEEGVNTVKATYEFTPEDIYNAIDNSIEKYNSLCILLQNGITPNNARNQRDEARQLGPEVYNYFKEIFLSIPQNQDFSQYRYNTFGIWNYLLKNNIIDGKDNRIDDYIYYYTRNYRLIELAKLSAPSMIINNELSLITQSDLVINHFKEFELLANKDIDKDIDEYSLG